MLGARLTRFVDRFRHRAEKVVQAPFEFGADGRLKEVWPREEWKTVQRGFDTLRKRGIEVYLRCDGPSCKKFTMTHHKEKDGDTIVRCPHKDRKFSRL